MGEPTNSRTVKSVQNGFEIIEFLKNTDGASITNIADELNLAKSTVYQQLSTLSKLGYVVQEEDAYHVGLKFLDIGEMARTRRHVYNLAEPLVEDLASESEERAQFFAEENGRGIYIHTEQGIHAVQTGRRVGKQRYLHSSAGGKAILAFLSEQRVDKIIGRWGLPQETTNTYTTRESLEENLSKIRDRRYSVNKAESIDGLWAIGVPVLRPDDTPAGALSISGPRHRIKSDKNRQEIIELLLTTANELELKLAYE